MIVTTTVAVWVLVLTLGNGNSSKVIGPYPNQESCKVASTYLDKVWRGDAADCFPVGPVERAK